MKRLMLLTVALSTALACDGGTDFAGDPNDDPFDTADPGPPTDTNDPNDPPPEDTAGPTTQGVQIGSEGIITACEVRDVAADASVPGFADTPGALSDVLLGDFAGTLTAGESGPAMLNLAAVSWAAIEGAGCPELIAVEVGGRIDAAPELDGTVAGWVLVASDATGSFSVWSADWQGNAAPVLNPADYDTVEVRLDGTVDPTAIDATVGFEACVSGTCILEDYGTLAVTPL